MRAFLDAARIDTRQILTIPDRVPGLYMIHLDGAERSFSYWRDTSAARLLASDRAKLRTVIAGAQAIYLSGITLAILPTSDASFLIDTLREAKAAGQDITFDPNIRPRLWTSPEQMTDTISKAARAASLILPSFDDEKAAFGDATPRDTLKRYSQPGTLVVVKNGSDTVLAGQGVQIDEIATPTVDDAVDTTGAGDSFNGAFLAEYLISRDVKAAIKAGQTCAARVICHHGAII